MTRATVLITLTGFLFAGVLVVGCGRDNSPAGAKLTGVGYDPGSVQPAPIPAGGLIDFTNLNMEATNLDLSVTGLYYPGDPFVDGTEPFHMVGGFSYVFHPALDAADELQLLSPKGPDAVDSCFVTKNRNGPLGSFTTVDVGDNIRFTSDNMRFELPRDPGDYPTDTTDVFIVYGGVEAKVSGHPDIDANFAYDTELTLEWDGGIPPDGAPVAAIPNPSWAGDDRTNKPSGSPTVWSPPKLEGVIVGDTDSPTSGDVLAFAPNNDWLDSPFDGTGDVLYVRWEPWEDAAAHSGQIVIQVRLLYTEDEGTALACPWDSSEQCDCVDLNPNDPEYDEDALGATDLYCDDGYAPLLGDAEPSSNEGDDSGLANCDDGLDNDWDFACDYGGCFCYWDPDDPTCPEWMDGQWMGPDPSCARHYQTSECRAVNGERRCFQVGGDRNIFEGGMAAELTCTVTDETGEFMIDADQIESLLDQVDVSRVGGAMFLIGRLVEERVTMPLVRDEIGNRVDIGQVRVRVSNISISRLAVDNASLNAN